MKVRILVITVIVCLLAGATFSHISAGPPAPHNQDGVQPVVTPVPSPTPVSQLGGGLIVNGVFNDTPPPPIPLSQPEGGVVVDAILSDTLPTPMLEATHGEPRHQAGPVAQAVTVINFDDVWPPCAFVNTVALRNEYQAMGVIFDGPGGNDGGAILDQCSNFNVNGHSPPNFLAFNASATLSDGGSPRDPEEITFVQMVSFVQVNAGSNSDSGQTLTMEAFDASNNSLGSDTITLSSTLQPLSISARGIARVVISSPASVFVLDDLTFSVEFDVAAYGTSSAPTMDGQISTGEWDNAGVYDITAPGLGSAVTLYAMHDGGHLYLAMDNPNDTTLHDYDQIGVYFDDNPLPSDGQWTNTSCGHPDGEGNFWVAHVYPDDQVKYREIVAGPTYCTSVIPAPGTSGEVGYASGHTQAEIAIDLTSSALRALVGDVINMYLWIYDYNSLTYGGEWPLGAGHSDPATYGQLTLPALIDRGNIYLPMVLKNYCDPYEPNNSRGTAWGPLTSGQTINATICAGDLRDVYYFDAGGEVSVEINLTNMPGNVNFDLYLWDETGGDPLAKSENGSGQDEHITGYTLPGAGRYYVDVYRRSGTGSYTLQGSGW